MQAIQISYLQEAQCVKLLYVLHDALISWKHFKLLEWDNTDTIQILITLHFKALGETNEDLVGVPWEVFNINWCVEWMKAKGLLYTGSWKHPISSFLF